MDISTFLKFVHVIAATLWVGGGFAIILSGVVMAKRSTAETQFALVRATIPLGPRLFMPVSVITLASGLALLFAAGWGWQPFTVLGLAGVLFTAGFGILVLEPAYKGALKIGDKQGPTFALPLLHRAQRLALMDYVIQFAIVFLMVVKPGWQDTAVFAALAGIIVTAALATFRPISRLA